MRSDLLVNNLVQTGVKTNKLKIFEPNFRRNFIHIRDVVRAVIFSSNNFKKLQSNVYNLGLSNANITKINFINGLTLTLYINTNLSLLKEEIRLVNG